MAKKNPERIPEKVKKVKVEKEEGYLYYVDKEGDVARVPAKWNEDPRFLEKIEKEEAEVDRKLASLNQQPPVKQPESSQQLPENIVYFDQYCIGAFDRPITKGHVRLTSKEPKNIITIPENELIQMMTITSVISSFLFENLGAEGSNIILNDGEKIEISAITRNSTDNLNLMWEMKQGDQEVIKSVAEAIKQKLIIGEVKDFSKVNLDDQNKPKKVNIVDPLPASKNYMIDHIHRTP